jgi:hypothetical protein
MKLLIFQSRVEEEERIGWWRISHQTFYHSLVLYRILEIEMRKLKFKCFDEC